MIYLKEIQFNPSPRGWAIDLSAFAGLKRMKMDADVIFLVGENGSGKSTLIETLAVMCGFDVMSGPANSRKQDADSDLSQNLQLEWRSEPGNGFFLRAESFFNYASDLDEMYNEMKEIDDMAGGRFSEVHKVYRSYGGKSLNQQSHGEAFRSMIQHRFNWPGLYLMDEPEAGLSPKNQMVFLSYLNKYCRQSQFIIVTHSPILMTFPNARIYNMDNSPLTESKLEDMEHFELTKNFLNHPNAYLHHLFVE